MLYIYIPYLMLSMRSIYIYIHISSEPPCFKSFMASSGFTTPLPVVRTAAVFMEGGKACL